MSDEFRTLLKNYLDGKGTQDSIRYWVSFNLDDAPDDAVPLICDVALAMWNTDDYGTEEDFRAAVAELLAEELAPAPSGDA